VEGPIEGEGVIEGPIEGIIEGVPEGITEGSVEGPTEGEGTVEGPSEGEGMVEGSQEGAVEGMPEGVVEGEGIEEGVVEGEGIQEGTVEGTPEGVVEGEGIPEGSIEGEIYLIQGQVINSISKRPVSGAKVELGSEGMTDMILVITDGDGKFSIETGVLQPPYNLTINMRKYISKTIQSVNSGENVSIELDPEDIQKPLKPRVYSTPQSIRIKWDASPEYNIAGYNIYRRTLDENGDTLVDWQRINVPDSETNPTIEPYEGYIQGLEYSDTSIQLGSYYQYAIQSVSDVDRYSVLSDASDIVKGQFLTVFFPEQVNINDASLFWLTPTEDPGQLQIRIPINSKSVYDVSATSVQIDAELPQNLILDPNSIIVEPSGITVGMFIAYGAFAIEDTNIISLRIASADFEAQELYGSGTLFNIVASVSPANEGEICEPLTLLPDDGMGNGVRLYDVTTSTTQPLKVDIENGLLCATNKCILGDADSNGAITPDDAQYILDYWTKSAGDNECIQSSGDINMDGLIDNADSSAIQRWLEGNNIIPPSEEDWFKKSYDHYWEHLKWLADNGSMSAETILATTEKQDTSVNVWLNKGLYGVKGSQKEISVLADNVSNMSGFAMMLNFDGKYAEVNEVVLGDVAQNLSLSYNEGADATGSLRIMAAGKDFLGVKGEVELVRIKFTMKQSGNAYLNLVQVSVNDVYAYVPMFNDPKAPVIVPTQIPKVTVPNVVGMTETEAQATLEQIDLFVSDVIEEVNNEVEPGKVLRQIPVPETEVDAGSTVVLYINKKQQTIEGTPEGTPEGTAEGVVEGTSEGTPEGTPDGTIEGIKEGAGEGTQGGTTEGEQQIKVIVPDVVGKTRDEATIAIKTVGLVVGNVTEEYNNDVGAGKVIRQNPIAGTKVDKGSAVDLVISKGKKRRFIISCGEGKGTIDGSYFADIMMLSVISMFLLGYKKSKRDIY
ncbi:MAG: PASTA domain-containing protein, partial [Candidatus Hydrogenedens sp.]|nr:PASTA domain-containing protein [Candidatus Hydrogenedens sp.]